MSIEVTHDQSKGILYISTGGDFTINEFIESLKSILSSPDYPPHINTIWDISQLSFNQIDSQFETSLVRILEQNPERASAMTAMVVDSNVGYGMARMFQSLYNQKDLPQRFSVFRNYADAEAWLLKKPVLN